ncbi:LOW QUALITY PROTEIN: ATP synthase subunit g, mitochondrial-like [Homalodisca vitripennis]|uniref:LOW QUALITY PROTEIN: ATP synthase subunit g, mitochondrial-like n=1 Tax=Homalodisca vitripennis TaxID=197043 RepID=UPI001EEC421F|nr:LOW QUALITY PROTEIN: ATP synthase subunit g, mitochondrial-like [Homalodisca vitripennis]
MAIVKAVMDTVRPNMATFLKYAKVELTPPGPGDIGAISRGIGDILSAARTGRWKQLTVKDAWLNILFVVLTEVSCWFWVGEVIGKRNLVGYNVEV